MPYGRLTDEQWASIEPHIHEKTVYDLGAGDLEHSQELKVRGAREVVAIDRHQMPQPKVGGVVTVRSHFHKWVLPSGMLDVVVLFWPMNWDLEISHILKKALKIIYLGCNTDSTACGDPTLWNHLKEREILDHVPDRRNVLIVYGGMCLGRELVPEEHAALNDYKIWKYDEIYGKT